MGMKPSKVLISREKIAARVAEMGRQITAELKERHGVDDKARVVLVPDDHRLVADLPGLCRLFRLFLAELGAMPRKD